MTRIGHAGFVAAAACLALLQEYTMGEQPNVIIIVAGELHAGIVVCVCVCVCACVCARVCMYVRVFFL